MFRPMRRFKQQMTPEACVEILKKSMRGVLAVSGDEGYPYTVPIDYYYDEPTGRLYFHCATTGHKIDALKRSDKVTFNILYNLGKKGGEWWYTIQSVIIFGRLHILDDEERAEAMLTKIGEKYFPPEVSVEEAVKSARGRIYILELVPEHISGKEVREK